MRRLVDWPWGAAQVLCLCVTYVIFLLRKPIGAVCLVATIPLTAHLVELLCTPHIDRIPGLFFFRALSLLLPVSLTALGLLLLLKDDIPSPE